MTNSLLDVSRLEAGRMPLQRSLTDLSVLAHSVVTRIRILQPTRDITVETSGDSACDCDPELTRRIIENLVSNAMKHTPIEGRVRPATNRRGLGLRSARSRSRRRAAQFESRTARHTGTCSSSNFLGASSSPNPVPEIGRSMGQRAWLIKLRRWDTNCHRWASGKKLKDGIPPRVCPLVIFQKSSPSVCA